MRPGLVRKPLWSGCCSLALGWLALCAGGCATGPQVGAKAERYRIEVRLEPPSHRLVGRASIDMALEETAGMGLGPVAFEFQLHRELSVRRVQTAGARLLRWSRSSAAAADAEIDPVRHVVLIDRSVKALTLFVEYDGPLAQDVAAGEKPGEIHNFEMKAHVGPEGVYLGEEGHWYPEPVKDGGSPPPLSDFTLIADRPGGMELAAGAERDVALSERTGRLAWRSPYPLRNLVLVGGPHQVHERQHRGMTLRAHLQPKQAALADGWLAAAAKYLDRYEPLIGAYPAREYTIVDNFFSSGFAFPTMTLLSSAVIEMGERAYNTHGYLDHEILHSWWGNGVYVDPRDGNWCESLASYAANYYGFVLDGNEEEARRKRRNYSHFFSRTAEGQDQPLGTYGLPGGCGRNIAYNKGAAVFHMLARTMGQDRFWEAMRRFTAERVGAYASWEDIREVCEAVSGTDFNEFFGQWVRGAGAPLIDIERASYNDMDKTVTLVVRQNEPPFEMNVPVHIKTAGAAVDLEIPIRSAREEVRTPIDVMPLELELDPDYQLFRRVRPEDIVPTTAATRSGSAFTCVFPPEPVHETYEQLAEAFESSFEPAERMRGRMGAMTEGALAERCVLILGSAARDPYVSAFLTAVEFPVRWIDDGFEYGGLEYVEPSDAVLCTVRHPGVPGGGITVLFGNSDAALPRAANVPMYEHSLIIFDAGRPVIREDFEHRRSVRIERQNSR